MRAHARIATVTAALLLGLAACATDAELDAPVASSTAAIHYCPDGEPPPCAPDPDDDPPPPPPPPRDPSRPRRPDLSTLRISTSALNALLLPRLRGTYVSIDTTHSAPPVPSGGERICYHLGGDAAYEAAYADCSELRGAARINCIKQVNQTYPLICNDAGTNFYSYIAFPAPLKAEFPDIQNELFDIQKIDRDTWYGKITIDLNQIHSVIGDQALSFYSGGGAGPAFLGFFLDAVSPSPTAYCYRDGVLPCPDVTLTSMKAQIAFTGLKPDPANLAGVTFSDVFADFKFSRDVNNLPEWLVDAFYDLDWKIESKVSDRLRSAFLHRQAGLSKLLTRIVEEYRRVDGHPPIRQIDEVMADSNYIYIHYFPM